MPGISKCILAPLFLILCTGVAHCQQNETLKRNISFDMGAMHSRFIDEAFSVERIKYSGTPFSMAIAHQRATARYVFNSELQITIGRVSTVLKRPKVDFRKIALNASYARRVLNYNMLSTSNTVYAGLQIMSANYGILDLEVLENITISSFHTINLMASQHTSLSNKDHLQFTLSLPLAGFIKRTAYDGGANAELEKQAEESLLNVLFQQSKFSIINPLKLPQFSAIYTHGITPKTDLIMNYQFNIVKNNKIAPISLYSNALLVGFRFNFNKSE